MQAGEGGRQFAVLQMAEEKVSAEYEAIAARREEKLPLLIKSEADLEQAIRVYTAVRQMETERQNHGHDG